MKRVMFSIGNSTVRCSASSDNDNFKGGTNMLFNGGMITIILHIKTVSVRLNWYCFRLVP